MTTDLVTYNTNGLTLKPGMAFDDWQGVGETLFKMEHLVNWALGDWWVYGERTYGESAAQAAPTGYALKTLQNAAWVADRIEPSRRREDLTWSHHCEVAALEPAKADELLSEAAAENWTRNDLRAEVRRVKHPERTAAKPDIEPLLESFAHACMDMLAELENDLCRFCNRAPTSHADDCYQYEAIKALDALQEAGWK